MGLLCRLTLITSMLTVIPPYDSPWFPSLTLPSPSKGAESSFTGLRLDDYRRSHWTQEEEEEEEIKEGRAGPTAW